jgi:catechol 2,3-dioxygenase-like lactoylglutathione lyase family enzyme
MKIKSVSGVTCYVTKLTKTIKFYETLGFEAKKKESNHATLYSNWFWIDFLASDIKERAEYKKVANLKSPAGGTFLYLSVDNVDDFYKMLLAKKVKPLTEPQDQPWGNREFIVRDPDGYNLVIFKRK